MAEETKKPRRRKTPETIRERASKQMATKAKKQTAPKRKRLSKPVAAAKSFGARTYHPVKLPDNKIGRFMTKHRSLTPKYLQEGWQELKQVTWPNRRETLHLTVAVFMFAAIFTIIIQAVNIGYETLFKELIIK